MNEQTRYYPEVKQRAVRLVLEHQGRVRVAMGSDVFNSREDRLYSGDVA